MKPKNIKHSIISIFCVTALLVSVSVSAQMRQTRGFEQTQTRTGQQPSDENRQALQEIEMMRQMIRERREQQEQQQRMLQELRQAAGIEENTIQPKYQEQEPNYQPVQERVTSGSILSQIEAEEREDMAMLQQKYDMEIQVAQKEIEMLKKQLAIANRQLDQCQEGSLNINNNSNYSNTVRPSFSEPVAKTKTVKPQKQAKKVKQQSNVQVQPVTQPQASDENRQAMREIEMMRELIRERRQQQAQQQKMIQDLQQALD